MTIDRSTKPLERFYTLNKQVLAQVAKAKYLEVMITDDFDRSSHVNSIVTKAKRCIDFIKKPISNWPQELIELAYVSLVRSQLEYTCVVWDPYQIKDVTNLEKVQRKAEDL